MENCIFCKIIKGEIPSSKVYEDENILVFMDISPVNKGHVLVIPKTHHETLLDLPDDLLEKMILVVKNVAGAMMKSLNCDGFNTGMNNYPAAGQIVPHAHIHIIPRFKDDGLQHWPGKKYKEGEIELFKDKIKEELDKNE